MNIKQLYGHEIDFWRTADLNAKQPFDGLNAIK